MGPASDSMAVVDSKLRVHGISNLRVVDASIQPDIVNVNTQSVTMLIGYHAADLILQDDPTECPPCGRKLRRKLLAGEGACDEFCTPCRARFAPSPLTPANSPHPLHHGIARTAMRAQRYKALGPGLPPKSPD
eukprot:6185279-Pleurochrysis_carterae.AAC.1